MQLSYKKPSNETVQAMYKALEKLRTSQRSYEQIQKTEEKITHFTKHDYVKLVNSGNSGIMAVMNSFKNKILVPDEGGWIGFKNLAEIMGLKVVTIPTNLGIIDPDTLNQFINMHQPDALFITSFAGYIAEQPMKDLYEVCDANNVTLVEDASGALGDPTKRLANGEHSHVIIASTGSPKIVNVGNGGFVSTSNKKILKDSKTILKSVQADSITAAGIYEEIDHAPYILSETIHASQKIKQELENVIHADKRGIVVALLVDNPKKTGYKLRNAIKAENRRIITVCPDYNRTLSPAVCIELKNLDVNCFKNEIIDEIILNINECIN
ncbi:MAG: DegT/DnrJ/EryC1/StrS family aminotransferase [Methanomicrobiales archaeon]